MRGKFAQEGLAGLWNAAVDKTIEIRRIDGCFNSVWNEGKQKYRLATNCHIYNQIDSPLLKAMRSFKKEFLG